MGKQKDALYNWAVRKNENVRNEYERYVMEHTTEHYENRFKHWKMLWKLNWHYRVKKKSEPMLYFDNVLPKADSNVNIRPEEKTGTEPKPKPKRNPLFAYADGPESEAFDRISPQHLVRRLLEFDVVSFDIFDTLILRPFSKPTDMFYLLEQKFEQQQFRNIRIQAERRARELSIMKRGNREITIDEIYTEVEKETGISKEVGIKTEFEMEKELCFANPYMKRVFDILKSHQKTIYVTSDMYLPKAMMEQLLENCGYSGFADVIVSCDYNVNKHEGGLYKVLLQKTKGKNLIHVGDNYNADIVMAKKHKIETAFYKGVNAVGGEYRADGMSELIGSGYAGIINARLHSGLKKYPVYYEYGYVYGGIYVLGYCNHIANFVKNHNIDKVLFVSRDGDIYSRIFNMVHKDIDNKYVYWSRIANIKATVTKDRHAFLNRLLDGKIANNVDVTISSLFVSAGIEPLTKYLKEYHLRPEEYLSQNNKLMIRDLLIEHYDEIIAIYKEDSRRLEEYYKTVVGTAEKVLIVDVGWTGSNVIGLSDMLEKEWKLCKRAYGIMAASNGWNHAVTTQYDDTAQIQPYLFGRVYNRAHYDGFVNNHKRAGHVLFEIMTQSPTPSFVGISEKEGFEFDVPEVENYAMIREIHRGVADFVKDYTKSFGAYRIMMNISGYDAYCPFRKAYRDLSYYKEFFSEFVFTTSVFSDQETQTIETLGEFLEKKGL